MFIQKNKKIYIEDISNVGDFVIYDSSIPHGVELIDKKPKKISLV